MSIIFVAARQRFFSQAMMLGMLGVGSPLPYARESDPGRRNPFSPIAKKQRDYSMVWIIHAHEIAPYLIKNLSLSRCRTLLDVGGGLGTYSIAFCHFYPHLRATLVEHPLYICSGPSSR